MTTRLKLNNIVCQMKATINLCYGWDHSGLGGSFSGDFLNIPVLSLSWLTDRTNTIIFASNYKLFWRHREPPYFNLKHLSLPLPESAICRKLLDSTCQPTLSNLGATNLQSCKVGQCNSDSKVQFFISDYSEAASILSNICLKFKNYCWMNDIKQLLYGKIKCNVVW